MKRCFCSVFIISALFLLGQSAFGYSVFVGIDDTLDLPTLDGFQFNASGANVGDLTLTIYHQGDASTSVDGMMLPGGVPDELDAGSSHLVLWEVIKLPSTNGVYGSNELGMADLVPGLLVSLEGPEMLTLDNFMLFSDERPDGFYPYPFVVSETILDDGSLYTYRCPVPIPPAALLLASGLAGMIAVGRKRIRRKEIEEKS
jgi:hypothetical protein